MFPLNSMLAAALLASPISEGENLDHLKSVRPALSSLAVHWEVLDPREVKYVLNRDDDLALDLKLLRQRWSDLQDAPPLDDCMRFPEKWLISELLSFNRAYRQSLEHRCSLELVHGWELREVLSEVDRLYQVWDMARDARCEYFYVSVRRGALKRLRDSVGDEAYYSGRLPSHVPVNRFAYLD